MVGNFCAAKKKRNVFLVCSERNYRSSASSANLWPATVDMSLQIRSREVYCEFRSVTSATKSPRREKVTIVQYLSFTRKQQKMNCVAEITM